MRLAIFLSVLFVFLSAHAGTVTENIYSVYGIFEQEETHDNLSIRFLGRKLGPKATVTLSDGRVFEGEGRSIPQVKGMYVYTVQLTDLEPKTEYSFIAGNQENGYTPALKFRTLTNGNDPVQVLQGGDMGTGKDIVDVARPSLDDEPDVILIGGDMSYADGKAKNFDKWLKWFSQMNQVMIRPDGRLIPLIVAIGNHEVDTFKVGDPEVRAPYFFSFFKQRGNKTYFARRLGAHSVLFVLDTGHAHAFHGKQVDWLEEAFQKYPTIRNRIAMYHAPLYPSHRSYNDPLSAMGRSAWLEVFDFYSLSLAFENHDHTFKRTHMLRRNQVVDFFGTVYVGDGCWGKSARETEDRWYLAKHQETAHVWSATLGVDKILMSAKGESGRLIDQFYIDQVSKQVVEVPFWAQGLPLFLQEAI